MHQSRDGQQARPHPVHGQVQLLHPEPSAVPALALGQPTEAEMLVVGERFAAVL